MGTRVSTPVGSTTSFGSMFETKLIRIIGIYTLLGCKHYSFSLLLRDGKIVSSLPEKFYTPGSLLES